MWETNLAAPVRAVYGLLNADPHTLYTDEGEAGQQAAADSFDVAGSVTAGSAFTPKPTNSLNMGIRAWHGSPHDFPEFDFSYMGKGEGNQAFGKGGYFAGREGIGQSYRKDLSYRSIKRKFLDELPQDADAAEVDELLTRGGVFDDRETAFLTELRNNDWLGYDYPSQAISAATRGKLDDFDPTPELKDATSKLGHLYEVDINAEPHMFIDYDKPLTEQSPEVQAALKKYYGFGYDSRVLDGWTGKDVTNNSANTRAHALDLHAMTGLPGIKYLDGSSRNVAQTAQSHLEYLQSQLATTESGLEKMRGDRYTPRSHVEQYEKDAAKYRAQIAAAQDELAQSSHNYVVFDDKLVSILKKYGIAGLLGSSAAMGAANQSEGEY